MKTFMSLLLTIFVAGQATFADTNPDNFTFSELTGQEKLYFTTNKFDPNSRSTLFSYGYEISVSVDHPQEYKLVDVPTAAIDLIGAGSFYSNYELISVTQLNK